MSIVATSIAITGGAATAAASTVIDGSAEGDGTEVVFGLIAGLLVTAIFLLPLVVADERRHRRFLKEMDEQRK